ncbi:unnamed protein product [Peronospora belbahrii]|uniref:Uncharacterized protein n=1 Tax=Peronospora belbahrii TaxID=622444 RepID=A0ABN8D127_9STRA|nr:unnamed protein product [Peronospora belbahrii]
MKIKQGRDTNEEKVKDEEEKGTRLLLDKRMDEETADADDSEELVVTFDILKNVLIEQYQSTRLADKDPFPLESWMKLKSRRLSVWIPPFVPGSTTGTNNHTMVDTMSHSVLCEFQAEVVKKSKSWLTRGRVRHLKLRWGVLEMHKRSLTVRPFRHRSSGTNPSASSTRSRVINTSSTTYPTTSTIEGAKIANTTTYYLQDLVSMKLEHMCDGESTFARKAVLTLKFQRMVAPLSNSHSNLSATAAHDIKTLILGSAEASATLSSVRDYVATFALYLELSRQDRLPSMAKIRRYLAAGAMVNVHVRIPRTFSSKALKEGFRRRSQTKQPPLGTMTALQLAFLQDPRVSSFESTIELLLSADADPSSLLYWNNATQVVFFLPSASSGCEEKSKKHHERWELRKRLLLLNKVKCDGDESAIFSCFKSQADDGARWNLLMYLCWLGDVKSVKQLLVVTGAGITRGSQVRSSGRQQATCLGHINATGDTALHVAIKSGHESVALLLVEAALSVNAQALHQCDGRGEPVVHLALIAHHWRVVDALVTGGAIDPRSYDAVRNTALHLAIELRAPLALIARLIQVYRHSPPSAGLDGRVGRRGSNDTPLSLAVKSGQQEVVVLLLASGASPSCQIVNDARHLPKSKKLDTKRGVGEKGLIGNNDSALHVAIKAGMELAAAALIAHRADIYAVDSCGASSLALAVRHGLYALAVALVGQHQKRQSHASSKHWWVDGETGRSVVMLAFQAGQLELGAFLLDCSLHDQDSQRQIYFAQLLPMLVQTSSWIETSYNSDSGGCTVAQSDVISIKTRGTRDCKVKIDGSLEERA